MESVEPSLIAILKQHDISHLLPNFSEGEVYSCSLVRMIEDESDIKVLAPKLGDRLKLKAMIKKLKEDSEEIAPWPPFGRSISRAETLLIGDDILLESIVNPNDILGHSSPNRNSPAELASSSRSNSEASTTACTADCHDEPPNVVSGMHDSSSTNLHDTLTKLHDASLTKLEPDLGNPKKVIANVTNERVKSILTSSNLGSGVLKQYSVNHKLSPAQQDLIIRVIIASVVEDATFSLSSS